MNRRDFFAAASGAAFCAAALPSFATTALAATPADPVFDDLLRRYVKAQPDGVNRVDYAAWKANAGDLAKLRKYIADMAALVPSRMPRDEAFAYWSNLYNAITLQVVLERFPVKSIREIRSDSFIDPKAYLGPWRTKRATVEGKPLSLDDIEHETLRPTFKDPRVHYAVNCASFGCPNLPLKAWNAATLDADLDDAAKAFINHPRGVTVLSSGKLKVSSIYKWFRDDFGADDAAVIKHLRKYAGPALTAALAKATEIGEDQYDWSLNVVGAKA